MDHADPFRWFSGRCLWPGHGGTYGERMRRGPSLARTRRAVPVSVLVLASCVLAGVDTGTVPSGTAVTAGAASPLPAMADHAGYLYGRAGGWHHRRRGPGSVRRRSCRLPDPRPPACR